MLVKSAKPPKPPKPPKPASAAQRSKLAKSAKLPDQSKADEATKMPKPNKNNPAEVEVPIELGVSLINIFKDLTDGRAKNHSHPLINIIVISLLATICGANDFEAFEVYGKSKFAFLSKFLDLSSGIPSHDTFNRVYLMISPTELQLLLINWLRYVLNGGLAGSHVAIDGKCNRASKDQVTKAAYLVNAWCVNYGLAIAQVKVDEKSNEITAIPPILQILNLFDINGCLITIDAMGAQREIAKTIIDMNAQYFLGLKNNQPKLAEDVRFMFESSIGQHKTMEGVSFHETEGYEHGRHEIRRCWTIGNLEYLEEHQWPGLKEIVMIERIRTEKGVTSRETHYYLSSSNGGAKAALVGVRAHWGVENNLHWQLDMTFNDDRNTTRRGHGVENLGILKKLALNLLKLTPTEKRMSVAGKRQLAGWDDNFLLSVINQLI
jgi:predicted transposase YbfD/YdcC